MYYIIVVIKKIQKRRITMITYNGNKVEGLKIAYIGGGSRGWAWGLMTDLAQAKDMSGTVALYDIDYEAAKANETIGNRIAIDNPDAEADNFTYVAAKTLDEALDGANFVVISILPGTFKEMESDVHTPEKYGVYQSVGDTSGLGGTIRALRTLPMYEVIAKAIEKNCPDAWVINYTNPMTLCVRMLYETFPKIKAFGCCHEVFGTQNFLKNMYCETMGIDKDSIKRDEIKVQVTGVNHFTWVTKASYRDVDLLAMLKPYAEKKLSIPVDDDKPDDSDNNWANAWRNMNRVKMDLFLRYGVLGAAGDRHLAEFCPNKWYLGSPENVWNWGFGLTPVSWRYHNLEERLARSAKLVSGEEKFKLNPTGEEGVIQMRALLGLADIVTNVNVPNMGQIPDMPIGAVVETNAHFTADSVLPVCAGPLPKQIKNLIEPISACQEMIIEAVKTRDLELAFRAFVNDPQNNLSLEDSRKLFDEMCENTKEYLRDYPKYK